MRNVIQTFCEHMLTPVFMKSPETTKPTICDRAWHGMVPVTAPNFKTKDAAHASEKGIGLLVDLIGWVNKTSWE